MRSTETAEGEMVALQYLSDVALQYSSDLSVHLKQKCNILVQMSGNHTILIMSGISSNESLLATQKCFSVHRLSKELNIFLP